MTKLPKLKIKLPFQDVVDDICDLEEARYRLDYGHDYFLIVVEGQLVHSYEDLVRLVQQERFRDRDFLEVWLQPIIVGG